MEQKREVNEQQEKMVTGVEDKVLKVAMQTFGEEVMKYLGQEGKVKRILPTEHIHLETKQLLEDFNFEMVGGLLRHYEFESDRVSIKDMRRFREYEAFLSMVHQAPVITTVVCSAKVKKIRSKLKEGINTYHVEIVQLNKMDADKVLGKVWKKLDLGKCLEKEDLISVVLTPLMSGAYSVYERIRQGFQILKKAQGTLDWEEIKKMQAMLYAFACKFLNEGELSRVKEETGMTLLGQLLVEDGIEIGMERGIEKGIRAFVNACKRLCIPQEEAIVNLEKEFDFSRERAEGYVSKYWEA